jgi:hypothetical protein
MIFLKLQTEDCHGIVAQQLNFSLLCRRVPNHSTSGFSPTAGDEQVVMPVGATQPGKKAAPLGIRRLLYHSGILASSQGFPHLVSATSSWRS